jgi:gliding motility-associated-like protein
MKKLVFISAFIIIHFYAAAQCPITSLGQNPPTAFPVCGTQVFHQSTVPICTGNSIYTGCTDGALYANKNPYWYKFTCYQSGTLGFVITPLAANEDYDWQLFDVTGLDPDAVYTDHSTIVTGNWSGTYAPTGTRAPGPRTIPYTTIRCSSDPNANEPTFETMPPIIQGHNYLLLVSHYTDTQSGYDLSFGGGTAVITDPLEPHLVSASAPCDGTEIRIVTNKKMKCRTLAADGSDFIVTTPSGATVLPVSASSSQCSLGFDMDTLSVFMPGPFAPGTYSIAAKTGTDANTLLDNCDRNIPVGESVTFTVYPLFPTPMDSLTPPKCAPQSFELVFRKKINCSSVAADGTDFTITGPYPVTVTGASTICDAGSQTYKILITTSAPLETGGTFNINLQQGSDGNTIIDECSKETPPSSISFTIKDTVNARFASNDIIYACDKNIVNYAHDGAHGVNFWHWTFGTAPDNFTQNPSVIYTNFEDKTTTLIVSNGFCSDTATAIVKFDNYIKAAFEVSALVCPEDKAVFKNNTIGTITEWKWTMGNGSIITAKDPLPQKYVPLESTDYIVYPELIAKNNYGCYDTIKMPVQVIFSCYIAVPSAFTPNGDGLNDFLYPLKAYKSSNLKFSVFNRFGERVFYSNSWLDKWDGKFKGLEQPPGTYVWMLEYMNTNNGNVVHQKGTSILIR